MCPSWRKAGQSEFGKYLLNFEHQTILFFILLSKF